MLNYLHTAHLKSYLMHFSLTKPVWSRFEMKISFLILMFKMIPSGIFNGQPKFEYKLSSYMKNAESGCMNCSLNLMRS